MRRTHRSILVTGGLIAGLVGSGTPQSAHASGTCSSTACTAHIIEFTVMSSRVRIRLDLDANQLAKLTNCTPEIGLYFTLWPAHNLYKETLMTLRSAQLAEREVTIRTVDGSTDCTVSYVRSY